MYNRTDNYITIYLIYYFKVQGQGGGRRETTNLPLTCSSDTHFLWKNESFLHMCTRVKSYWESIEKASMTWKLHAWGLTLSETQGPLALRDTHGPIAPDIFSSLEVWEEKRFRWLNRTLDNVIHFTLQFKSILTPTIIPSLPKSLQKPCETLHCSLCWRLFGRSAWKETCWRNRPWQCGP